MVRLCDLKWGKRKFWDHTVLPGGVMLWRSNEDNDHWPLHTYQVDGAGLTLGSNMGRIDSAVLAGRIHAQAECRKGYSRTVPVLASGKLMHVCREALKIAGVFTPGG
jgi:hypothetical protein